MTELREEGGSTLESLLTLIASHTISRLDKTATCNIKWWLWTNVRTIAWVFRTWFCSLLLWNSWDLHSSLCPFETGNSLKWCPFMCSPWLPTTDITWLCFSNIFCNLCTCTFLWQVSFFYWCPSLRVSFFSYTVQSNFCMQTPLKITFKLRTHQAGVCL